MKREETESLGLAMDAWDHRDNWKHFVSAQPDHRVVVEDWPSTAEDAYREAVRAARRRKARDEERF